MGNMNCWPFSKRADDEQSEISESSTSTIIAEADGGSVTNEPVEETLNET